MIPTFLGIHPTLVGSFVRYSAAAWVLSGLFRRPSHAREEGGNNPFLIWNGGLCYAIRLIRDANNVVYVEASDGSSLRISENWIIF